MQLSLYLRTTHLSHSQFKHKWNKSFLLEKNAYATLIEENWIAVGGLIHHPQTIESKAQGKAHTRRCLIGSVSTPFHGSTEIVVILHHLSIYRPKTMVLAPVLLALSVSPSQKEIFT
jgi:endonuclease/exonuclease/phosphatase family metal-dependent hydrolase